MISREEQYLRDKIRILQEQHAAVLKPYFERLAAIESMRPMPPVFLTQEMAAAAGFIPPPNCRPPGW